MFHPAWVTQVYTLLPLKPTGARAAGSSNAGATGYNRQFLRSRKRRDMVFFLERKAP